MGHAPFREDLRGTRGFREALFQSVITHYYTFIHTGCKVPWALRGLLRRGGAVTAVTSAVQSEKCPRPFSLVQPVCQRNCTTIPCRQRQRTIRSFADCIHCQSIGSTAALPMGTGAARG